MSKQTWQIEQGAKCPCGGADDYCPCQNTDENDPAVWANRIGEMAKQMILMAPRAGVYVSVRIEPARLSPSPTLSADIAGVQEVADV